jgi:hypothetical protein
METESERLLERFLPSAWIVRRLPKDYGVDYEVEIVDHFEVSAKRFWIQLKSVDKELEVRTRFNRMFEQEEAYVSYSLDTGFLAYAIKSPFPLLLFLADLTQEEVYWLPLQDAITYALSKRNAAWRSQDSATVRIPAKNRLSRERENDYPGLRWYALEPSRVYALVRLHELLMSVQYSVYSDFQFDDDWIDLYEETRLRQTAQALRGLIGQALEIDVLFGETGVDYYSIWIPRLGASLQSADRVLDLLDQGKFSFDELSTSVLVAQEAVAILERLTTSYFELNRRFTLWEELAT